jgi:alkanesulfonate monooxygenase SsuD/methylene tetrahydromethanopterin reductase-like flavin-dependent oxidoreductase (luciferase family)
MKVIEGSFGKQAPSDLSQRLRELADEVDEGLITGMIVGFVHEGNYSFLWGASLSESLILAALLQQTSIDNMRA